MELGSESGREFGSIDREIYIEASPDVVYRVVSSAEHVREWWADDAAFDSAPDAEGFVAFGDQSRPDAKRERLTVLEADPPHRFSFAWVYDKAAPESPTSALTVTFDLVASGAGTLLRFSEKGFRERGWEGAVLEAAYHDHVRGWDIFLPRLATYAVTLVATP